MEEIKSKCDNSLQALEIWEVDEYKLINRSLEFMKTPEDVNDSDYRLNHYEDMSHDHRFLIDEVNVCLDVAKARAAMFMPRLLPTIKKSYRFVNDLIAEIGYLNDSAKPKPPNWIDARDPNQLDLNERTQRIHQATGLLVQLNSQLSYVISQAFSGMPPLINHECQIRSFSLLGVGLAFKGLDALAKHIEKVFSKFPIDNVIEERYTIRPYFKVFREIAKFDSSSWKEFCNHLDEDLNFVKSDDYKSKFVAYSGRQGFRESEPAVTVPLWVLSFSDTGRWSLMTISHELLHGHVKALLGTIFGDNKKPLFSKLEEWVGFYNNIHAGSLSLSNHYCIDCLRFIIINYCATLYSIKKSMAECNGDYSELDMSAYKIVDIDAFANDLSEDYREINEIITHVLDYYYFYDGKAEQYLGLLWASWTPVPAVRDNINKYLLRSLITVGTSQPGDVMTKFKESLRAHKKALSDLYNRRPDNPVVKIALESLENDQVEYYLNALFYPGIYVAEMAKCFLKSTAIHGELMADKYIDWDQGKNQDCYDFGEGEFPGHSIESPVAFILDRLNNRLKNENGELGNQHRSCWLLLACASSLD